MNKQIKVLIVEDSPLASQLLSFIINADPEMEVIGAVSSGEEALESIKAIRPTVITMDIVLPGMDGFETTQKILQTSSIPISIIIVSSNFQHDDIKLSFKAIAAGAIDIIEKPAGPRDPEFKTMAEALLKSIRNSVNLNLNPSEPGPALDAAMFTELNLSARIQAVAIGASLGGPKALFAILSSLPAQFPAPIFLVQHISSGFTEGFVNWLNQTTELTVKIAEHQEIAQSGTVYVAPDKCHLEAGPDQTIFLNTAPPKGGLCPSVTHLFQSMAAHYGLNGLGIILTGMGKDGAEGLLAMKKNGAITVAQDEQSSLVFGMPKEAIALGAVDYILSLQQISELLKSIKKR